MRDEMPQPRYEGIAKYQGKTWHELLNADRELRQRWYLRCVVSGTLGVAVGWGLSWLM